MKSGGGTAREREGVKSVNAGTCAEETKVLVVGRVYQQLISDRRIT